MQILRQHRLAASDAKDDPAAKLRADIFYPIIARAITQSPSSEARQTFYDRAREVLTNKLYGQDPALIAHEQRALEIAIRRVEALANGREIVSQNYRLANPPSYWRPVDAKAPSSPPAKMPLLAKLLFAILLGGMVAAAMTQSPIRWRQLLIWCCGI